MSEIKADCYWYREESDMGTRIPCCELSQSPYITAERCDQCDDYHSKYKKTIADVIRGFGDRALATTLICFGGKEKTPEEWLAWLREEIEE